MTIPTCRLCAAPLTFTVIDLGKQPLANSYVDPASETSEPVYPLHARLCEECGLVQVDDVVPAQDIFGDYAYFSSFSDSWVEHSRRYAKGAMERLELASVDLVVEVASNDGYLLQWFQNDGVRVQGVEPAANVAAVAIERGIPTTTAFFGATTARSLRDEHGHARLIAANNVLAHVPDLNDFVEGLAVLLASNGRISVEFPHLLNLVQDVQFDTIYHEHFSYFSLIAAQAAFRRHGLAVVDVDLLPTHGGSLRLWVGHADEDPTISDSVAELLAVERAAGLDRPAGYQNFAIRAQHCRDGMIEFLDRAADAGKRVVAYGAAAKGNTLLNFAGIGTDRLPYVADRNPHKQGLLLPGSRIPVLDPSQIAIDRPDLLLVLPWNLRDEIEAQMSGIRDWGGRFATAVPSIELF